MQTIILISQYISLIVLMLVAVLFLAKTVWNLVVPFAIIRETLDGPDHKHGWSLFVLLDFALLLTAALCSAIAGEFKGIGVWNVIIYGLIAIAASYVNLIVVLGIARCFIGPGSRHG